MAINGYSTDLASGLQDYIWGYGTYTPGTSFWVALYTTVPEPDGTGGVEVTGGSYARVETTQASWNNASIVPTYVSKTDNASDITFPTSTASWGTVNGFGILSASTAGTLLVGGSLTVPKLIDIDTVAVFLVGDLVINSVNQ